MLHRNLQTHPTGRGFSLRLILMYYSLHCHFLIFFILCHDRSSVKEFFLSVTKHPSNFFLYPAVGNKKPSTTGLCSGRIKGPKGGMGDRGLTVPPTSLSSHLYGNLSSGTAVFVIAYPCCIQHPFGCNHRRGIRIFIAIIDNGLDPGLYDCFCAFVAGKQGNI